MTALLAIMLCMPVVAASYAAICYVDQGGGGDFTTIQAAVYAAAAGTR